MHIPHRRSLSATADLTSLVRNGRHTAALPRLARQLWSWVARYHAHASPRRTFCAALRASVVPLSRIIFGRQDAMGNAPPLRMPRIVLHGAADLPRSTNEAERMARALACLLILLPGVGHIASLEAPELVTEHLLGFLRRAGLGTAP